MRMKYLGIIASVLLLAACQTTPDGAGTGNSTGVRSTTGAGMSSDLTAQQLQQALADLKNIGDRVFFGYDRSDLSAKAREVLDQQAKWLNSYRGLRVTIEGHADERGTREYNLALGESRANAVKNYLVAKGVDADRISVISYGKERPAVVGSDEASWAQNRRGVTVVN